MSLWEALLHELESTGVDGLELRRASKAILVLQSTLGEGFVAAIDVCLDPAQIVQLPGSRDDWVVYTTYADGTYDLIKRGGMFPEDSLVGWTPGQSPSAYFKELDSMYEPEEEVVITEPDELSRRHVGIARTSQKWRNRKKPKEQKRKLVRPEIRSTSVPLQVAADSYSKG